MDKKKKNILIGGLLAIVLVMAVGYAAFATNLNITSSAGTTSTWDIEITNIQADKTATCTDSSDPSTCSTVGDISHSITDNNLTANFSSALISPGDSVVYTITVQNKGTLDATLSTITRTNSNNAAISFEIAGIAEGDSLAANQSKQFTATVIYVNQGGGQGQPASTSASFGVTLNYTQYAAAPTPSLVIDQTFVPQYYAYHTDTVTIGQSYDTSSWTTNPASLGKDYYLGHDVDSTTGNVTANYACFILNNTQYCMKAKDPSSGTGYFNENKALLGTLKDATPPAIICTTFSDSWAICNGGSLGYLMSSSAGGVDAGVSNSVRCATGNGRAYCNE